MIPDGLPADSKRRLEDSGEMFLSLSGEPKKAFASLLERLLASPDKSYLTRDFLDTPVDWIPGLIKGVQLKHLPSFVTKDAEDKTFNYNLETTKHLLNAESTILNTFDDSEGEVLEGIRTNIPDLYTIGPLSLLSQRAEVEKSGSNLWKEDTNCLAWLDKRCPKSVIYVNYGSLATLTRKQLEEIAWGLADSKHPFLWVIRDNLVNGESGTISEDYSKEIKGQGLVSGWCPQEKALKHPSIAVFWTHSGWNSTLESICEGIPMICCPFFTEQPITCLHACNKWGVGVEIAENGQADMKREEIADLIKEMMEGVKGAETRAKATEWKQKAEKATKPGGSSHNNFEKLVKLLEEISTKDVKNKRQETRGIHCTVLK